MKPPRRSLFKSPTHHDWFMIGLVLGLVIGGLSTTVTVIVLRALGL